MTEPDRDAQRAHVKIVEVAADALFAAAATAVVATVAFALALLLVGGWVPWVVLAIGVPAPLVAAFVSLNSRLTDLRRRIARGQSVL